MDQIKIYSEEELKKLSMEELDKIFDEFLEFANWYSSFISWLIESKEQE